MKPNVIHDEAQFASVIDEIAFWPLQKRREFIAEIDKAYGPESAHQLKDGLTELWKKK
jgi:hypothetical protein